jgi:hypothetical protein
VLGLKNTKAANAAGTSTRTVPSAKRKISRERRGIAPLQQCDQVRSGFCVCLRSCRLLLRSSEGQWLDLRSIERDWEARRLAVELGKDDAITMAASAWALAYVVCNLEVAAGLIDRALALNSNLAEA